MAGKSAVWRVSPRKWLASTPIAADLQDATALHQSLAHVDPTHVFICTWLRQDSEAENVRVNGDMVRNLFAALEGKGLVHAALVTGTKHYLGPFESYGQTNAETPFREDNPRLPGLNFYYTQEDLLFEAAAKGGFGWTVHRSHTVIGYARGNAMNMGVTLAVYATLCRERGEPFVFPGSHEQWNALTDVTDARILAEQLEWAATTPAAYSHAFNISNGDLFRWRWLWPQLAAYFGVEPQGPADDTRPAGSPDEWSCRGVESHRRQTRSRRAGRKPARFLVAHGRRSRTHHRVRQRHDAKPPTWIFCLPADARLVFRSVRPSQSRAHHPRVSLVPECLKSNFRFPTISRRFCDASGAGVATRFGARCRRKRPSKT